jgi:lysophospholipase L1-like esterase
LPDAATTDHWYFIQAIDVEAVAPSAAVVILGDSITDGRGSTTNANDRWPDFLARRMQANPATAPLSVLNQGIGGNAVLSGGLGPTAIARFDRDVLSQRGVRWLIVLEGVNDIGGSGDASVAGRLISAYDGLIDAAHERGLLVYGVPILPFGDSGYDSPLHEAARQEVNAWVRTSGRFDAVIDLDRVVADPAVPNRLLPAYDSGDQLHLSPAGYEAMAEAVDLGLFVP